MNSLSLSTRVSQLAPSPTLAITARAKTLQAAGADIVSLAAGEPDGNTPEPICEAAIAAIRSGFTKYTATPGIVELREAIAAKLGRENGVEAAADQIVVTCGAKQAIYNALMAILDPGDEAILFAPYWMTYAEQVRLAGGQPLVVPTSPADGYLPDLDALQHAVSTRTRAIVLNSPCNPTGAVFPRELIEGIVSLALRHGLWIVSDEIYEKLIYEGVHCSPGGLSKEASERTITVNGCSKTYAMTGWRIGYLAAPLPVAKAIANLQDQITSNANSFAQKGALAAFSMPESSITALRDGFRQRRDRMLDLLEGIPGLQVRRPAGAFYVLANVERYLGGRFDRDLELASFLLDEFGVACIPGSVFEGPGHLRLSYAASTSDIERGVERLSRAFRSLYP